MPKLKSISELFDERAEVMAWVVFITSVVLFFFGMEAMYMIAAWAMSLSTMGVMKKFKAGPSGVDIDTTGGDK